MQKTKLQKIKPKVMARKTKNSIQKSNRLAAPARLLAGFVALLLGLNIGISLPIAGFDSSLLRGDLASSTNATITFSDGSTALFDASKVEKASIAQFGDAGFLQIVLQLKDGSELKSNPFQPKTANQAAQVKALQEKVAQAPTVVSRDQGVNSIQANKTPTRDQGADSVATTPKVGRDMGVDSIAATPKVGRDQGADSIAATPKIGRDMGADSVAAQNKQVDITPELRAAVIACAIAIKQDPANGKNSAACTEAPKSSSAAAAASEADPKSGLQKEAADLNALSERYSACLKTALAAKDKKDFDEKSADCSAAMAELTKKQNELSAKVQAASAEAQLAFAKSSESAALESAFQEIASLQNQMKVKATSSFSGSAAASPAPAAASAVPGPVSAATTPAPAAGSTPQQLMVDATIAAQKYSACAKSALALGAKASFEGKKLECDTLKESASKKYVEVMDTLSKPQNATLLSSDGYDTLYAAVNEQNGLHQQMIAKKDSFNAAPAAATASPASSSSLGGATAVSSSSGGALDASPAPNRIEIRLATALVQLEPFLKQKGVVSIQQGSGMTSHSLFPPAQKAEAPGTVLLTKLPSAILGADAKSLLTSNPRDTTSYTLTYAPGKTGPNEIAIPLQDYSTNTEYNVQDIVTGVKSMFR